MTDLRVNLKLRFTGADADNHVLSLYDSAYSIYGMARALDIALHLFVNKEVIKKATASKNFKSYVTPAKKGSYEQDIILLFQNHPLEAALVSNAIYEFLKMVFKYMLKKPSESSEAPKDSLMHTEYEPYLAEVRSVLENPIIDAHRVIKSQPDCKISLNIIDSDIKDNNVFVLNIDSYNYLNSQTEESKIIESHGNITKYNILTKFGRVYLDYYGKTVPFSLDESFNESEKKNLITWSMDNKNKGMSGILHFYFTETKSRNKTVKISLTNCEKI